MQVMYGGVRLRLPPFTPGTNIGHRNHILGQQNAFHGQMTKRITGEGSHARSSVDVDEAEDLGEDQPLRTLSHEGEVEEVDGFVASYGLDEHVDVFRKAADQLRARHVEAGGDSHDLTAAEAEAMEAEISHKWRQRPMLYFTVLLCALAAIEQGFAQTGMNGANLYIPTALGIDASTARNAFILGLINCGIYLAQGLCGAVLASPVNKRIGRRGAIFVATTLCLLGNVGSALSNSWQVMVLCRLVLGTGLGLNSSSVNVFAAESAPAYIRGGLAVSWQMSTAFGILLGFIANLVLHDFSANLSWRLQLAAPLLPTVVLLPLIYVCPESPSWSIKGDRYDDAYHALQRLRNTDLQAAIEVYSTYLSRLTATQTSNHSDTKASQSSFFSLFTVPRNRHAVYASYTVMLSQQLCGINIIAFYSSTLFSTSTSDPTTALWASVIFGLVNFLGAIPAIWTMDTFGRRRLLLWTLPPMALTMLAASLTFTLPAGSTRFVLLAALVYLFCALYSPGMGPVPCAYSAEVFGLEVREVGMAFAIATASIWATVLSLTFPVLLQGLGEQGSFGLYAGLNLVAWAICWGFVRETRGVKLDEMDEVFQASAADFVRDNWDNVVGIVKGGKRKGKGWEPVAQEE